jgi:hypothetical protein
MLRIPRCCDGPEHNVCSNPLGDFPRVFLIYKKKQVFTSQELLLLLCPPSSLLARRRRLTASHPTDSVFIHHPSAVSSPLVIATARQPFLSATPTTQRSSDIYVTKQKLVSSFLLFETVTNFFILLFGFCFCLSFLFFSISNFRRVLNVVCFLLRDSVGSEFYMSTSRNTLSVTSS